MGANIPNSLTSVNPNIDRAQPEQPGLGWGLAGECYEGGGKPKKPLPFFAECRDTRTKGGGATKSVFMALAARVNPTKGPVCYPSVQTIARDASVSVSTAHRALKRLAGDGFISIEPRQRRLDGGKLVATSNEYKITPGTPPPCHSDTTPLSQWNHPPVTVTPKEERKEQPKSKVRSLSGDSSESPGDSLESHVTDGVQTIDPSEPGTPEKAFRDRDFPSKSKRKEKARAPVPKAHGPKSDPTPVDKYFKLLRKLNYEVNDELGIAFEKLPHHRDRKAILDDLEAEERDLAHQGKLSFAPVPMPKRLGELSALAITTAFEQRHSAACAHIPAEDLPINCARCGIYIGGA